jgi:hypothetical protein
MRLTGITVLGLSFCEERRIRLWRTPWRYCCLIDFQTWIRERLTTRETILLRHENCLTSPVFVGCTSRRQGARGAGMAGLPGGAVQWQLMWAGRG